MDYTSLLKSALCEILPEDLGQAVCPISDEPKFVYEEEKERMRAAGNYRKNEFIAGRECARSALEAVGFSRAPILPDEDGVPLWPEGAIGAISHSRGYCAAIAGKRCDYRLLGLDLEKTNRLSPSAIKRTVHPDEQVYVKDDQKRASLIFCAKEAFFKAQFPVWETHANFHDLILAVDSTHGKLKILKTGKRFPHELVLLAPMIEFRFRYFEDFVVTACWLKESDAL